MSLSGHELKHKFNELQNERREYLHIKGNTITNIIRNNSITTNRDSTTVDLKEIDQEIDALTSIISTSVKIAMSIINPIKEKETIISNINNTVNILEIEKKIKDGLTTLEQETIIEKKISIILEANKLIKLNSSIGESYLDKFMQKSLDVLSYGNTTYLSGKNKITNSNEKEAAEYINEMDRTSILNYTLSNKIDHLTTFFSFLGSGITIFIAPETKLTEIEETLKTKIMNGNSIALNREDIAQTLVKIKYLITKVFKRISLLIQERQSNYLSLQSVEHPIFYFLICKLVSGSSSLISTLLGYLVTISNISMNNPEYYDGLCVDCSSVLSSCEKIKFYISTLSGKVKDYYLNKLSNSIKKDDVFDREYNAFFKEFESKLYDIGEKYCMNEINFMKTKIIDEFRNDSLSYTAMINDNINNNFEELSGSALSCIEDTFYILKMSGERAISTLNLQMALAIINHIKEIINEELFFGLDNKISAIFIKTETYSNMNEESIRKIKNISYKCSHEPSGGYTNTYGNLYLITCGDSIQQTRENIKYLLDELKDSINVNIVNSEAFDIKNIRLTSTEDQGNDVKSSNQPRTPGREDIKASYFKKNELEMINITFSDTTILLKKYDDFLQKKLSYTFEYLYPRINSSIDILNSVNYGIDQNNLVTAEMSESFSGKFINETRKILRQWKEQMSDKTYDKFIEYYAEYSASYIEKLLKRKHYSSYGVIILQKDINKIVNYFQGDLLINIREKFCRLFYIVNIGNFETKEELNEHLKKYDDIKMKRTDIDVIRGGKKE